MRHSLKLLPDLQNKEILVNVSQLVGDDVLEEVSI